MKELSIEEKAKRFDEALATAKECITYVPNDAVNKYMLNMFPELKESEDERIRKAIKSVISYNIGNNKIYGVSKEDMLAWLEKQGEQKSNDISPIFRVGDYIRNKKTGDKVLIEQLDIATKAYCYVSYDGGAEIHSDFSFSKQDEWMLIGQNIVEQKPAWSEEDASLCARIQGILSVCKSHSLLSPDLYKEMCDWLKALKERYTWKPSEEQMQALSIAMQGVNDPLFSLYQDLKKLREK